ncbi:TonB-dependent receptor [Acidomonas methanolica]|uniref:TonB-dependent receptor n=1 Tax=Acidomonas methanolica TaxID=437 RepID=UPI00211A7092|nr:TonB-dependent receptor [Acidomonas methanolica]MCQ9156665.1 TonB-dependent receptor [Acidomonas methanolica]
MTFRLPALRRPHAPARHARQPRAGRTARAFLLLSAATSFPALAAGQAAHAAKPGSRQAKAARPVASKVAQIRAHDAETLSVTGVSHDRKLRHQALETPSSVSVLSAVTLRNLGVTNVRELAGLTPNLYEPRATIGFAVTNYFIRGIGELDPQGEPSVGTYVDGVYLPRNLGTMQELLDVADVQIDRGPVGFTAGHQAEGGAVRINSIVPTNTARLHVLAGYGTYNEYRLALAASGALVRDKVYASLAVDRHGRDGFDHNYTLDSSENNIDYTQARGKLRFTPNDRWDIQIAFDGTVDGSTNRGYGTLLNAYRYGLHSNIYPKNNYSEAGVTANVDYILNPHLRIHSVSAVRGYDDTGFYDNYGSYFIQRSQLLYYRDRAYSEDLSLRGEYGKLHFTTGAFFMYEDWFTNRRANNTYGSWYPDGTAAELQKYQPVQAVIDQLTRIWAVYGQVEYAITPALKATVALRFNYESHSNAETLNYLASGPGHVVGWPEDLNTLYSAQPGASAWPGKASAQASWYQILPKGALRWQATPNVAPYVSISQGSKSGGFDYRAQSPGAANMRQALLPYKPEMVTTFEIGVKTLSFARRLELTGALFYNKFNNIQLTTYDATTALSHRFNAGNGHSAGAETEATVHLTPDWDIRATASYLYARLDSFKGVYRPPIRLSDGSTYSNTPHAGATLPYSPRAQVSAASSYRFRLPRVPGRFRIGADVSFQSSLFLDGNENAQTRLPSQTYLNAIASWTSPDTRWVVTANGRNLIDRRFPQSLSYILGPAQGGVYSPSGYAAAYANPRTIFVSVEYRL